MPDALMTAACRRLWRLGTRTAREAPAVDIAAVAAARTAGRPAEDELPPEGGWELEDGWELGDVRWIMAGVAAAGTAPRRVAETTR
ncbi:hypothetical protein [Streptomyces sp. NPDC050485]|uniref:hypothetical protein n=1 Tax=Streptomyces sp. NPDC050485 TaxID=3365617 RepID=UPI0037BD7DE1